MNTSPSPQTRAGGLSAGQLRFAFFRYLLLVAGLALLPAVQAVVTLPYYDGFDYASGSTLGSATGGSNNWTIGNSVGGGTPTNTAAATLGYSGLPAATGIGVRVRYPGTSSKERGVDTGAGVLNMTNATAYASFLVNIQTYPSSNCPVAYFDDNGGASASFQGVGMLSDGRLTLHRNAGSAAPGGTNAAALSTNTTYLIVFRYQFFSGSANDQLALWVNPPLGQPAETTPDLTIATGGSDRPLLQGFFIKQDASFSADLFFDELRLGTNWTDVTPSAICRPAGFATSPVNATNVSGGTVSFSLIATGSVPALQWQVKTNGGSSFANVSSGTGGTTTNYTTTALVAGDGGNQYRCIASVACDSSSATSAVATVSVVDITGKFFRSADDGNWNDAATWEQSINGTTWTAAQAAPSTLASNITVRSNHTVTVDANASADQLKIEAGGKISVAGGNFTIANAADAFDLEVAGTLEVEAGAGTNAFGTAGIRFQNGGVFNWNRAAAPAIPTATWQDGSTCRISATTLGSSVFATGISGQSYYDFVFNTAAAGQNNRCRLDIKGTSTTVRRDFSITIPDTANASVTINNETNGVLTVGRNVTFVTGASANSTKVLLNNASGDSYVFKVGGNFSASGFLDGFGSSSTFFEFNGTDSQTLTLPVGANLITRSAMNWAVDTDSTLSLASRIDGCDSLTADGTVELNGFSLTTDSVDGTGSIRNEGGGAGQLILGGNTTNTLGATPALLNGTSGTLGLVKGGTGLLLITAPHTFTGGLTVSNGTALVNNTSGSGTGSGQVTVVGGTLGGTGSVGGLITVEASGTIAPGASVGTLTGTTNITLAGTLALELNRTGAPTSDKLVSTGGTITYGGALSVKNIGPALQVGDSFQLFTNAVPGFSSIVLSPIDDTGAVYTWTNKVAINGSIQVIGVTERIYAVTIANQLISFGSAAPGTVLSGVGITGLQPVEAVVGIDFQTNTLFAVGDSSRLYTINRVTGEATAVGGPFSPVLNGTVYGMEVEPAGVRVVTDLKQHLLLDTTTGAATDLAALNGTPDPTISGLAYHSGTGQRYVADYVQNTFGTLNPSTGLVTPVGLAGIDFARNNGFDISDGTAHTAYLATPATSSGTAANLYTVNLGNGASTLVGLIGNVGDDYLLRGLAVGPGVSAAGPAIASNRTNLTFSATGSILNLSWPADHLGWTLQAQTNSRALGLKTNWVDVVGSASMTATNFLINKADPTVFYRLKLVVP